MLLRSDLYDLSFVLRLIRSDIGNPINDLVIRNMVVVLNKNPDEYLENEVRVALSRIDGLDSERWKFTFILNYYVSNSVIKNTQFYEIMICALEELRNLISMKQLDKAYDLADALHALPEIAADNRGVIPKSCWRTYINTYRKKWDKSFLRNQQESIIKKLFSRNTWNA